MQGQAYDCSCRNLALEHMYLFSVFCLLSMNSARKHVAKDLCEPAGTSLACHLCSSVLISQKGVRNNLKEPFFSSSAVSERKELA